MAHKLYRLLDGLYNTPHLILESSLVPIIDYLQTRNNYNFEAPSEVTAKEEPEAPSMVGGIGEIKIDGVLSYKPVMGLCGPSGTSYQGILEQASELIAAGVDTIILTHSSPGGEAAHVFSTAIELREMADDAGVKLISYIDELSASAALGLGVIADEIIIHPSARTGSIGCVLVLYDKSKALADAGIKPVYIASTAGKTPFKDDGSFSKEFLKTVQEDVTRLGNEFAEHVSKFTGIPVETILDMDAKMFHAEKALEVGLVNKIMDHKQFANYMAESKRNKNA